MIGANSGPLTERLWLCYPERFDVVTRLRVHRIPSTFMFFDWSEEAIGMRYHDNNNREGAVVDGKPDPIVRGELVWQFLTGAQGSLLILYAVDTTAEVEDEVAEVGGRFYVTKRSFMKSRQAGTTTRVTLVPPGSIVL